jgi:hypothetical protein
MSIKTVVAALAVALGISGCADELRDSEAVSRASESQTAVVAKLRTHCQACHAVGSLRFIYSDDNQTVWNELFTRRAPGTGKLWAEGIVEVLSWPSDTPPAHDQPMDPPNRDWMPKGAKRADLAGDRLENQPARRVIIERLGDELESRSR